MSQEIRLPTKRDDAPTLQERMTGNAYDNILPARYMRKDPDGSFTEEQEDVFQRVAKNIALAEAAFVDEEIDITHAHIKPDHPRREELIDEVFGEEEETTLDDKNVKWVSYDSIIDDLPEGARGAVESKMATFKDMMSYLEFIPNTPTLMNAGDELQQLSACFVDSPGDDIKDIHHTAEEAAEVFQSGGGMGYAFWNLRPYGDAVGSTGGIASGPITFMRTYDQMCETIAQGGARRGAQMGVMRISHPDVIQFIHAKNKDVSLAETLRLNDPDDYTHTSFGDALEEAREFIDDQGRVPEHLRNACEGHLSNFNISVGVSDGFMEALNNDEEYTFTNPRTEEPHIATEETKEMYGWFGLGDYVEVGEELSIPASIMWDRIIDGAHENGEPGVVYLERANKQHSFDVGKHPEHQILATNPCGEQPLEEYEACNLGHINLSTIVSEDAPYWGDYDGDIEAFLQDAIDWEEFDYRIENGTRFLENVVTMSAFPVDKIEEKVAEMRKIGLGVMGLAQLYIQLGIRYGSEEGNEVAREVMKHINHESKWASHEIAEERGSFDEWDKSKYASPSEYQEWFEHHTGLKAEKFPEGFHIRNHNTTTIAPTGTTSMLGNTTGGCEPIYNVAYYKNVSQDIQGDEMLVEFDDYFLRTLEENDINVEEVKEECAEQMDNNEFDGVEGLDSVPSEIAKLFVTTGDLTGLEHAGVQTACQEGVDSAISKTCNFPNDATKEDMDEVYRYIYENGGKGVTVYRDGTRSKQVLTTRADNKESAEDLSREEAVERIEELSAEHTIPLGWGEEVEAPSQKNKPRQRPDTLASESHRVSTGVGNMYVNIGHDSAGAFEAFVNIGKSGGFTQSLTEAMGRLISLHLRSGGDIDDVVAQLDGIRGPNVSWDNGEQVNSIPDGIALALKRFQEQEDREVITSDGASESAEESSERADGGVAEIVANGESPECPECGAMKVIQEGCEKCDSCGWSRCK